MNYKLELVRDRLRGTVAEGWLGWPGWLRTFFRTREFTIEWDGKVRGKSKTNVGASQGSPLSLVISLNYMAPILEDMERRLTGTVWEKAADIWQKRWSGDPGGEEC